MPQIDFTDTLPEGPMLRTIKGRESGGKNLPPEANYAYPRSHASGDFQIQPGTWKDWTRQFGIGAQAKEAYQAPEAQQTLVSALALRKYGANSPYTWAASGPYREQGKKQPQQAPQKPAGGLLDFSDTMPAGKTFTPQKEKGGLLDFHDTMPPHRTIDAPWRVDPKHEGPRSNVRTGIEDPSIAAHQPDQGIAAKIAAAGQWIKKNYPDLQIADMMGDLTNWAAGKGQDALESAFTKAGVPDAGRAARDLTQYAVEFMPLQSGLGKMGFKPHLDLGGIRPPAEAGTPGTGVPHIPGEPAAAVPPAPFPKYQPIPGGGVHAPEVPPESPVAAENVVPLRPTAGPDSKPLSKALGDLWKDEGGALQLPFLGGGPPKPPKDWVRTIEDGFQKVRGSSTADRAQIKQWVDSLPKEVRDPKLLGRLFAFGEGDRAVALTPRERQQFDQYVQPMRDENRQLYNTLKNAGLKDDALDPDHMHRAVMGRTREYDPYIGSGSEETPVVGYKSTSPSAARSRQYYVLEDANGQRQVIWEHPKTGSISTVAGGTHTPIKLDQVPKRGGGTKAPDIKPGESVTMGGQSYTVKNALTREIEANTSTRYYKNALASVIRANTQLKSANRLLDFLRDIKQTPEFQDWAKPNYVREADQLRQEGWRKPNLGGMPIFDEFLMHPTLAGAIEDFYGSMAQKGSLVEKLYKLTRFTVQSMFWSPLVHQSNAAFHWATARGIDWVNPMGYKRLASTVPRAIYETVTQGPKYQSLLREGAGLVYGGLAQRDFFEHILKAVGENVVRQPSKWGPIADVLRVGTTDLVKMLYTGSAKALWSVSDMMLVQRILELEQKGMGTQEAIHEAEKHLPNYRIPTEVMGSRALAQGLKNVGLTEFSRYHYGMIKSVAHMARDLVSPKATLKERFEAMGSIMATGVLMAIVTPYLSKKLQQATGDEKIEYSPKGSTVIPQSFWDTFVTGKGDIFSFLNRMITINPVLQTAVEAVKNRDMFTGHNIVSPGDLVKHPVRFFGRGADYAAQRLVNPYGTVAQGLQKGIGGLGEQILKQSVGARNKPKLFESKSERRYQAGHRGPLEKGAGWAYDELRKLGPSYGGAQ